MSRILVVEDERNAREALGEIFSSQHEVDLAEDVAEARAAMERAMPDLVLTDVVLPGDEDGLDLLRFVRAQDASVPVIVMTAYGSVEKAVHAMRDGAHDFLEKPLDLGRLRRLVASTLESRTGAEQSAPFRGNLERAGVPPGFVGEAPAVLDVFRLVQGVGELAAPIPLSSRRVPPSDRCRARRSGEPSPESDSERGDEGVETLAERVARRADGFCRRRGNGLLVP